MSFAGLCFNVIVKAEADQPLWNVNQVLLFLELDGFQISTYVHVEEA